MLGGMLPVISTLTFKGLNLSIVISRQLFYRRLPGGIFAPGKF
ncbi:hypothetical protein DCCM_3313 [Desulfocucumis palustris]|uniref:Uncharacterized protein n=1 Tax=Desulfocucumis palustris TaxID=1898651 RepID=A0A2L2XJV5_9FIRM|nr:hypothetical protein DCCM_3313 [Desulfocucumis palustris]